MSQKELKRLALKYLEACSDRDFDALNAILATDITLCERRFQNEKNVAHVLARGLKPVTKWLKDHWKGKLARRVEPEDIVIRDSFIYVRYVLRKTLNAGTGFHVVDGRIAEIWLHDSISDSQAYEFLAKLAGGGYALSA